VTLYYLENYRTEDQLAEMRRLEAAGICLFCPDGIRRHKRQQILWQTSHWTVTPNKFPYAGTRLHLLLIPHEHVGDLLDLPAAARQDFWVVLGWVRERFALDHYGLGVRNGDCRFTGGTIRHVHAHVLVGDGGGTPVRMRFSSTPG